MLPLCGIVVIGYLLKFAKLVRNWYVDFSRSYEKMKIGVICAFASEIVKKK